MSPTVLESKKAISWHRVWRKRAARILKRFQYSMFLPNLTSLPSFMMVCMKMLPEWRREEQSFARRRLEKDLKKKKQEILHLRMRTVLALVLSMQLRREESQRREGRARS